MNTGLYRLEWTRLASGGHFFGRPDKAPVNHFRTGLIGLAVVLAAGCGGWVLLSGHRGDPVVSEPVHLVAAALLEPATSPATATAPDGLPLDPEEIVPEQPAPIDGLKISSQRWRRGGLGSNALVTFTLRNRNDYAVKDIEISCAFSRRDGSHLTDRARMIHDTVKMKSRKTFARLHIGFVNVNANQARCSLVSASHI
ncbi:hypothetical protein [Bradyrhizobium canariense]|uniref:Uncharacterized protein n=1 Tax=Bradyrhizobium canariense TaxID=255045 RepID=A0A1H1NTS7_9BRAD|nr:hypothetical protein [Bradyrhizobium canariense]SDS02391.1 hypothetical protein SAMN05444158_0757 [Bradyrhizobium canariense]